jgi:hypothetical protein
VTRTDEELLDAIAVLYAAVDAAPADLVEGVLARLAVEDVEEEYELLTLVEHLDHAAGTRAVPEVAAPNDAATVALEFAGTSHRVLVRISTVDGRRRIDGWVVPGVRLQVVLGDQDGAGAHLRQSTESDADGRFELTTPVTGMVRLWLVPRAADGSARVAPFVTPPFAL